MSLHFNLFKNHQHLGRPKDTTDIEISIGQSSVSKYANKEFLLKAKYIYGISFIRNQPDTSQDQPDQEIIGRL